jgi:glycine/D-amino acid oxidase-like deaminating enzyme/nitrite reductase/ring-hydroxylating ferredoxin subunit
MLQLNDQSESMWQELPRLIYSPLTEDAECDVCVIGGGITGLSVAYHLLLDGHRVIVIDRDQIGSHETGHTSAHLSNALDDGYITLRRMYGLVGSQLAFESHTQAIDRIQEIIFENGIDCDFKRVSGYLFLDDQTPIETLKKELEAVREAGGENVEWFEQLLISGRDRGPCLHYPRQAQFHPLKYLNGLAKSVERLGGRIFSQTAAHKIKGGENAHVTTTRNATIRANQIVVATNSPVNDIVTMHTKLAAYRSYVIAVKAPPQWQESALFWDTASPYHYLRSYRRETGEDLVLIGGGDHRTGQALHPEEIYQQLIEWTRQFFNADPTVIAKWSGQIIEPVDVLGYIGPNPGDENVFIVTGDSGHGLTHGTIAGILLRELVAGKTHPWAELYDPKRLRLRGIESYVEENLKTVKQYGDWVSAGDVQTTADIPCGHGAVIRHGLNKIAAYRDEHGVLHSFSAVCPHLKGLVHWNAAESTWDCPCHGSRFSRTGKVLNGPAIDGLTPVEEPETTAPLVMPKAEAPNQLTPGLDFT